MHTVVSQNVDEYIEANPMLEEFFKRLQSAGKQLFLVTNSPYAFVYVQKKQFFLTISS